MNKSELIDAMALHSGLKKTDATKALDAFIGAVVQSLKNKDEVRLVGFGTFYVTERAETEGRNPRTGEKIKIPAQKQPKFRPAKGLKDDIA